MTDKLSKIELEDLLAGVEARPLTDLDGFRNWLMSVPLYPGPTREPAAKLYALYSDWQRSNPAYPLMTIVAWGLAMSAIFVKHKGRQAIHYLVSRDPVPNLSVNQRDLLLPKSRRKP